jgi:hypothetical protein
VVRADRPVRDLVAAKDAGATAADLVIAGGPPAALRLAEHNPWGHIHVSGTGAPPYPLEAVEVDLPAQAAGIAVIRVALLQL